MNMQDRVYFLYDYLLIIIMFFIQTTVNLFFSLPAYALNKSLFSEEERGKDDLEVLNREVK